MPWKDIEKRREYDRERQLNPKRIAQKKAERAANRDFRYGLLSQFPCCCCGLNDHNVIEWHHVIESDKLFSISVLGYSHDKWWNEVLKCIPVCSNCHVKIHKQLLCLLPIQR